MPFLIRWPGRIPSQRVSNEIVHEMDLFPTFARNAGGKVPDDRVIDGVDQADLLTDTAPKSNRESVVIYVGSQLFGVKWRDGKLMVKEVLLDAWSGRRWLAVS